jgi:FKBP-type peptidyl-prolyl cis-trans isomerase SlyD
MRIGNDCWVQVRYRLYDSDGDAVEDSARELEYLQGGYGEVFEAIERALEGKQAGDHASVKVQPHESFGDYDEQLVQLAPRSRFPADLEPGMTFEASVFGEADGSDRVYVVTDIAEDVVVIDANHPLAGMALRYEIDVLSVRAATAEEVAQSMRERGNAPPTVH